MNPITKAMEEGYDDDQILHFISQAYPHLTKKISSALKSGYSPKNILNFVTPFFSSSQPTRGTSQQAVHAEKRKQDIEANKRLMKSTVQGALTVGGGYLAARALQGAPKIAQQIGGMLGTTSMGQTPKQTAEAPVAEALGQTLQQSQQTAIEPSIPQQQVQEPSSQQILEQMGLTERIQNLSKNNSPDIVASAVKSMMTPGQKTWLKSQTQKPIEEIVKESLSVQPNVLETKQVEDEKERPSQKMVALPDGRVGDLIEEKQGIASVQLPNGQIRRRKMDDLVQEPPELEKQITDLLDALPEKDKSAVLAYASYTPEAEFEMGGKKHKGPFMGVQFHNGDFYMYPDVTKEQFDKVVSKATKAKTTGENPWHAWTQGKESRGAGMHELIKELEANFGKNFIKLKGSEGYDYFKLIRQIVQKISREKRKKH